jgi:small subunit ribosomal protein S16
MVGILEPQFRVGKIQGQVIRADSAAKSIVPEVQRVEEVREVETVIKESEA